MKKRLLLATIGIFFIGLFFAFTFLVRSDVLRPFDFNMTVKIQDNLPIRAYRYLELIGESARFEIITLLIFIVLAAWRQWWQMIIVFGTYVGAHLFELIGKLILSQPPPPFQFYKLQSNVWFPSNYVAEGANSYPSGHSLRAFFFTVVIGSMVFSSKKTPLIIKGVFVIGILGYAALVALAKVALGQHWITDVMAGTMLGMGMGILSAAFFNYSFKKNFHLKSRDMK